VHVSARLGKHVRAHHRDRHPGTASSCTESALSSAVAFGGVITFNCGSAVTTIKLTQLLVAPYLKDTVIDGNDRIVLDGGGTTQLLRAVGIDFRKNDRTLTVQRLTMTNGRDAGTGFKARNGQTTCAWDYKEGGGGAIYTSDVNLNVWGVNFINNKGPEIGPDVGGGAIRMVGAKTLTVANSTFRGNSASNGGAIGVLHVATKLYNTTFDANVATGTLANFANATGCPTFNHAEQGGAGGLGGAFYSDGFDPGDTFCGVRMSDNDAGTGDGGALKLTGLTVSADDVSFTNNKASWGGGVAHWGGGLEGVGTAKNIRYSGNTPQDYVGDFPR
jgi:hypothetical protein